MGEPRKRHVGRTGDEGDQGGPLRALLAAVGTRGDVQPALALALALRKLGHAVRLCISPNFVATATAARAGVPQVITPMFGDQFYWASRIVDLGAGAATPYSKMTEESLTSALRVVCDPAVVVRARTLAKHVGRDGAEIAARRLEVEYGAAEK